MPTLRHFSKARTAGICGNDSSGSYGTLEQAPFHVMGRTRLIHHQLAGANPFSGQAKLCFCIGLFLLSLTLRLLYAHLVLEDFSHVSAAQLKSSNIGYLTMDSPGYLEPALALIGHHWREAVSLTRPIGYPAFLALFEANPSAILMVQALLLAFVPVCAFLLTHFLTRSRGVSVAVGLISCLSPSGVAIGSLIMSDGLFAVLFSLVFSTLLYGALRKSVRWVIVSGVLSGLAILVRPILLFWPVLGVLEFWLILLYASKSSTVRVYERARSKYVQALLLFVIPTIFVMCWSWANYLQNGVFTLSLIGNETVRTYLAARAEQWALAGHSPSPEAIKQDRDSLSAHLESLQPKERSALCVRESLTIFRKFPLQSLEAFGTDVAENVDEGWDYFGRQLPRSSPKMQRFLYLVRRLDSYFQKTAISLTLLAPLIALIAAKYGKSAHASEVVPILGALAFPVIAFLMMSGITFWTGPRLLYPVEIIELLSISISITSLYKSWHAMRQ